MQLVICGLLDGCGPDERPREHVQQARSAMPTVPVTAAEVASVGDYYARRDIGGGWSVVGAHAGDQAVEAQLVMPNEQACQFKGDTQRARDVLFAVACPAVNDAVWSAVDGSHDIVLVTVCDRQPFDRHSCKAFPFHGAPQPR